MKTLVILSAATGIALAGAALAQPAPPAPPTSQAPQTQGAPERRPGLTRAEIDALTDARMAAIQAGLKLSADQQRLWTPVEQALRSMAAERAQRIEERRQQRAQGPQQPPRPQTDLAQRLEQRAERLTQAAQRLTTLSTAVKPFYASLTDDQKRLLPVLMRQGAPRWRMGIRERFENRRMQGGGAQQAPQAPRP